MQVELSSIIKLKIDSEENWNTNNPILKNGEVGIATTSSPEGKYLKIGDGETNWVSLSPFQISLENVSGFSEYQSEIDAKLNKFTYVRLSGG